MSQAAAVVASSNNDWKENLNIPEKDTRIQTAVSCDLIWISIF